MSALSHGVIRVDQENSLTSLTLQDCGHILPGGEFSYSISILHLHKIRSTKYAKKNSQHFQEKSKKHDTRGNFLLDQQVFDP